MNGLRFTEQQLADMVAKSKARLVQPLVPVGRFEVDPPPKMRNIPTVADGIRFASKKEAKRWETLKALQANGNISELAHHVRFQIEVRGQPICEYEADFCYRQDGALVVEDVKGRKAGPAYQMFRIKAKLMKACLNIEIREV